MENYIILAVVIIIVSAVAIYLFREKKRGAVCVGCPYAKQCGGKCGSTGGEPKKQ